MSLTYLQIEVKLFLLTEEGIKSRFSQTPAFFFGSTSVRPLNTVLILVFSGHPGRKKNTFRLVEDLLTS